MHYNLSSYTCWIDISTQYVYALEHTEYREENSDIFSQVVCALHGIVISFIGLIGKSS